MSLEKADIKKFPDGSIWLICPYCKKKALKIMPDTQIHNMPFKCRGTNCRREFMAEVEQAKN